MTAIYHCGRCGEAGHNRRTCPEPKPDPDAAERYRKWKQGLYCEACRGYGHSIHECPEERTAETVLLDHNRLLVHVPRHDEEGRLTLRLEREHIGDSWKIVSAGEERHPSSVFGGLHVQEGDLEIPEIHSGLLAEKWNAQRD